MDENLGISAIMNETVRYYCVIYGDCSKHVQYRLKNGQ